MTIRSYRHLMRPRERRASRCGFADTSRDGTRATQGLPWSPSPRVPESLHFPQIKITREGRQIVAPQGYAFDGRGDLISLRREAMRRGRVA